MLTTITRDDITVKFQIAEISAAISVDYVSGERIIILVLRCFGQFDRLQNGYKASG